MRLSRVCVAAIPLIVAAPAIAQKTLAWPASTTLPSFPGLIADFNSDGKLDLIIVPAGQSVPLQLLLGNGDGTFRPGPQPNTGPATLAASGDFNGDGKPDLVACTTNGSQPQLTILLNTGNAIFRQSQILPLAACNGSLIVADFNHDGKADIYDSGEYIWFGNGDGTFNGPATYTQGEPDYQNGGLPYSPLVADFNGDGLPDLAVIGNYIYGHAVQVWFNQGGSFPSQPVQVVNFTAAADTTNADSLAAGDFNGDGKTDFAAMSALGPLRIFLNNGYGTFRAGAQYQLPWGAVGLYAVDIDGGGTADLVVTSGQISILRGHGDGTFGQRIDLCTPGPLGLPFDIGGNNGFLLFGDFNGDGIQDIVDALSPQAAEEPITTSALLLSGLSAPPALSGSPVNAATFAAGPVSSGGLVTIFGEGLGQLACGGSGQEVTFNGFPAGILYASPTQINAQVPWELAGANQAQMVALRNGMPSAPLTVTVAAASPGIFTLPGTNVGAIVPAGSSQAASPANPVLRGQYASIYATGLGSVTSAPATGQYSPWSPLAQTTVPPTVTIGGVSTLASWAGLTPSFIGLYQVNFKVPQNAPTGDAVPITLAVGSAMSNTVTTAVK
jgi:uncharacterized protein (TIGR03437 family)